MIIRRIRIRNFQAHRSLDIELADFSAIVGPSSSGKTAILRALEWACYGEWDATYPTDPEIETSIAIQLDDGTVIARSRLGDKNRAAIRKPGQDAVPFEDFGAIVPGLYDLLNVREIQAGTRTVNLNFSRQDDPVFMIGGSWSGPAKAAWLGRLYGAHIITAMLRLMASDKREHEAARKRLDVESQALVARLDAYGDTAAQSLSISEARAKLDRAEKLYSCTEEIKNILEKTEELGERAALGLTDMVRLRSDTVRLQDLQEWVKDDISCTDARDAMSGRLGLLKLSLGQLRADAERLAGLVACANESSALAGNGLETRARLGRLTAIDTQALKIDLSRMERLLLAKLDWESYATKWETVTVENRAAAVELSDLKADFKKFMLAKNGCPICGSDAVNLDPASLVSNLKSFMGA